MSKLDEFFVMGMVAFTFFVVLYGVTGGFAKDYPPKGESITTLGFCLEYEDAKELADRLVTNQQYAITSYFKSKSNTCYHKVTHPLVPFEVTDLKRMGYTASNTYKQGVKRVKVDIWRGRAVKNGTLVYVWFYVQSAEA